MRKTYTSYGYVSIYAMENARYFEREYVYTCMLVGGHRGEGWLIEKTITKMNKQAAIVGLMGWALGRSGGCRSSVQCRTAKIPLSRSRLRLHSPGLITFCLRISSQ